MNIRKAVDYSTMFATLESVMKADLPQMELYCEIGKAVCAHSEKGAAVAAAEFIKEQYPDMTGFSPRNVRRMRDFWQLYSGTPELLGEALHLNWTQNVVIMEAELPAVERRWYIRQAAAQNLSKSELLQMIEDSAYLESVLDEKVDVWYNEGNVIHVKRPSDDKLHCALHGMTRALLHNMVVGVSEGFKKELEVNGIGYRAAKEGKNLVMNLGYSHQVIVPEIDGITIDVPAQNKIVISGPDKQKVGQFAAEVREKRPPEPYKGKGIKYVDEVIRRKVGKTGAKK